MTNTLNTGGSDAPVKKGHMSRFIQSTELDTRLLGMLGALALIWFGFHIYGAVVNGFGAFLTPRNLWNLSVQTSSIGIMACGMVLVIITRHIDLSVGSVLGFCAIVMGVTQVWILPELIGFEHWSIWIITVIVGLIAGTLIGGLHGYLIAYHSIPAFIVTLGGLLAWRGAAFLVARGETISPVDSTFRLLGGTADGAIGSTGSWVVGLVGVTTVIVSVSLDRHKRKTHGFALRPVWADWFIAVVGSAALIGAVILVNSYYWPRGIVRKFADENNIVIPDAGLFISYGFAIPVLILVTVGIIMSLVMSRTRFGRYVYAIGGNPEAAALAGINTKWMTVKIFGLMGLLTGLSAAVASARLGSATNALGTLDELYVIAAAVIGGTSLAGGVGTIYGAILGAVVMQSLQTGMVLIGFDAAIQQIVVGSVLVLAVYLDNLYRRTAK
ncbi:MAG: sugar ABC transporter permease [Tateyamaria sp.]|jgi:D-xylose transport system permease protein|nr:sugar ABC transporter permease [Tateyamaria sp.]